MAVPITVGGQIIVLPSQSDKFAWGTAVTAAIVLLAANSIQTTGGLQSLTAELDLGSAFGLKVLYLKSRAANPATASPFPAFVRMGTDDVLAWRNFANTGNVRLYKDDTTDELYWANATNSRFDQITGQPFVLATGCTTSFVNGASTVAAWTTSVVDTDSAFNAGTGTFTVPPGKTGAYVCNVKVRIAGLTANTGLNFGVWQVNGATVDEVVFGNGFNGVEQSFAHTAFLNVSPGQTIKWAFGNNNGGARTPTVSATDNIFSIKRLV